MITDPVFRGYEYAIGGKMIVGTATISEAFGALIQDGEKEAKLQLKTELIRQMVSFILENNLVEFTYFNNPSDFSKTVKVRAYLAPNDQVKILRTVNKIHEHN